jgi:hypothetical protein
MTTSTSNNTDNGREREEPSIRTRTATLTRGAPMGPQRNPPPCAMINSVPALAALV